MTRRIKAIIVRYLTQSGLLHLFKTFSGRKHIILTFHRVRPSGQPLDPFDTCPSLSVEMFKKILSYVKKHYQTIPLRDLTQIMGSRESLAAITFDDGWRDTYEVAFPLLQELGITATVFVTTGKIGSGRPFWQQALGECFRAVIDRENAEGQERLRSLIGVDGGVLLDGELYQKTVEKWKSISSSDQQRKLALIGPIYTSPENSRRFLNIGEIRTMAQFGIEFGTHTVSHVILPRESDSVVRSELFESKKTLEGILGGSIDMLAYPNGEVSDEIIQTARALGYRVGCTTQERALTKKEDLFQLPRIDPDWEEMQDGQGRFNEYLFKWNAK